VRNGIGSVVQRLSGLDAAFLSMETPTMKMHVVGVFVFDPSAVPGGFSFARIRETIESRLHLLPPCRRRAVPVPFQIHHPVWIEDPGFDLEYHLRRACLPAPGGRRELAEFVADVAGRSLDLTRPLWEMYVVEGLEDGQVALVTKMHHAAIDGISGAELAVGFLDLELDPPPVAPPERPWTPDRVPSDVELLVHAGRSMLEHPTNLVEAVRRTVESALSLRERNRQAGVAPPPAPFSAPRSAFNGSIGPHRRYAFTELSLDSIKDVKNAMAVTVNDVILAICAGALRSYLIDHADIPEDPLVAMVPVSVRSDEERGTLGNRISAMLVSLATDIDDPLERLMTIARGTRSAKEQDRAIGADTLTNWAEFAAPAVAARAARLVSRTKVFDRLRPMFNVTISNVPGPSFPLYGVGARMTAMYPVGPIVEGVALNMTAMSYMGTVFFGLLGCRDRVPHLDDLAHGLEQSGAELACALERRSGKARSRVSRGSARLALPDVAHPAGERVPEGAPVQARPGEAPGSSSADVGRGVRHTLSVELEEIVRVTESPPAAPEPLRRRPAGPGSV